MTRAYRGLKKDSPVFPLASSVDMFDEIPCRRGKDPVGAKIPSPFKFSLTHELVRAV